MSPTTLARARSPWERPLQVAPCPLPPATRRCSATRTAPTPPASAAPMAAGRCRPATRSSSTRPGGRRSAPWNPSLRHAPTPTDLRAIREQPRPRSHPPPARPPHGRHPRRRHAGRRAGAGRLLPPPLPAHVHQHHPTAPRLGGPPRPLRAPRPVPARRPLRDLGGRHAGPARSPRVAACDGALAVAYGKLDGPGIVETSAWRWVVFGFLPVEPLPGPGTPTCVDIDGDGRTEPAIMERSAR